MYELPKIEGATLPFPMKLPYTVRIEVQYPRFVDHGGVRYWRTGKVGTNVKNGTPAAEYTAGGRVGWLNASTGDFEQE